MNLIEVGGPPADLDADGLAIVWRFNPIRVNEPGYRTAVLAFLRRHVPGATTGTVYADNTGRRVLLAETLHGDDADFHRDQTGRVRSRTVLAELDDPKEPLP